MKGFKSTISPAIGSAGYRDQPNKRFGWVQVNHKMPDTVHQVNGLAIQF